MSRLLFIALLLTGTGAFAASSKKEVKKPSTLRTDIRFSDGDVSGKYQVGGEGLATVENEKSLMDLIEPRRHFKDRLRKSVSQR